MPSNKRLIQEWLPIKEIGIESRRERAASSALPPLYFLYIWWARRPLTASRAAILGALLPAWEGNEAQLTRHFPDENAYHTWFKRLLGIPADRANVDPVKTAQAIANARQTGENLGANPYGYSRAFSNAIGEDDIKLLGAVLQESVGTPSPHILDSMAGGGSIPFEALRLGFPTSASELNSVACTVLKGTLEYPLNFGEALIKDIKNWADQWGRKIEEKLKGFYPLPANENVFGYLWARTMPCPTTGKPVPLSPNWWLRRQGNDSVAVHLLPGESKWKECRFEIVRGKQKELEGKCAPDQGTVRRGNGISPWSGDPIPGDYIKQVAQQGRMGSQLYALCVDQGRGRDFRLPASDDLAGVRRAEAALKEHSAAWLAKGLIPIEEFPLDVNDPRPRTYGMERWHKLFAPRQLLALVAYLETLRELAPHMEQELGQERAALSAPTWG
jgi:putative DNA methylase